MRATTALLLLRKYPLQNLCAAENRANITMNFTFSPESLFGNSGPKIRDFRTGFRDPEFGSGVGQQNSGLVGNRETKFGTPLI